MVDDLVYLFSFKYDAFENPAVKFAVETVSDNTGTVSDNTGTVSDNTGTVSDNTGTVSGVTFIIFNLKDYFLNED